MSTNTELVMKGFAAFETGDMATLDALIADDVLWVAETGGVLSGRFEGKQELFALWARIPEETAGSFHQDVVELFGDEHVVVAVTESTADRRGRHLAKARGVIVFVIKHGRVAEGRVIAADPDEGNVFWAE